VRQTVSMTKSLTNSNVNITHFIDKFFDRQRMVIVVTKISVLLQPKAYNNYKLIHPCTCFMIVLTDSSYHITSADKSGDDQHQIPLYFREIHARSIFRRTVDSVGQVRLWRGGGPGLAEVPQRPRTGVDGCKAPDRALTARCRSLAIHHVVVRSATQASVK